MKHVQSFTTHSWKYIYSVLIENLNIRGGCCGSLRAGWSSQGRDVRQLVKHV